MGKRFFLKNESGEFVEATDSDYEEAFRERSEKIIAKKLPSSLEKALAEERPAFVEKIRKEEASKIREEVENEFKPKLDEAEKKAGNLETQLRRKTIAAEYGFKPETEEFLGNGSEEEMRAKADTLKNSFASAQTGNFPDKQPGEPGSESLKKYGLDVKV